MAQYLDTLVFVAGALLIACAVHLWLWRQHHARISIVPWTAIVAVVALASYSAHFAGTRARADMAGMVVGYAPTYAAEIARLGHAAVDLSTSATAPNYLELIAAEKRWLATNPGVNDIYTMRRDADGKVRFVVDSETDYDRDGRFDGSREGRTAIGEVFENDSSALARAFAGEGGFDGEPYTDRWGVWVSAHWPVHRDDGRVDAVVGVDYAAQDWLATTQRARLGVFGIAAVVLVLVLAATAVVALQSAQLRLREENARVLLQAKDAAEEASRVKGRFLANMSHEIRTPIHGIMGLAQLLSRSSLDDRQRRWVELLGGSVDTLHTIVNDILDYSKLEADRVVMEAIAFDPRARARDVIDLYAAKAGEKSLGLDVRIADDVPPRLIGDPTRLGQVLGNLVANAIKFTARGNVRVGLRVERAASGERLRFDVTDTGIGIEPAQRERLFQPFEQADGSTTRLYGGTGLGLAISRRLVALMGGSLELVTTPGAGATFWFSVPVVITGVDRAAATAAV